MTKRIAKQMTHIANELDQIGMKEAANQIDQQLVKMAENATEIVRAAIEETKRSEPQHWDSTLRQRTSNKVGSYYEMSPAELEKALLSATWEVYNHPNIGGGAKGYKAPLKGKLNIVALKSLPPNTPLVLGDPHNVGGLDAILENGGKGWDVDFTTLLVGPEKNVQIVWTLFPGDPAPSTLSDDDIAKIKATGIKEGTKLTAQEAIKLGLHIAKIR